MGVLGLIIMSIINQVRLSCCWVVFGLGCDKRGKEVQGLKCDKCQNLDSEEHLLWCKGYADFRDHLNLENEKEQYLLKIVSKRSKENNENSVPIDHFLGQTEPSIILWDS